MIDRYADREIVTNNSDLYKEMIENRNVSQIKHYISPQFVFPSTGQYKNIPTVKHIWKVGDRFYKLASEYYGDPKDWWIIAKFNNKPTESHLNVGDVIYIPTQIHTVLNYMKG